MHISIFVLDSYFFIRNQYTSTIYVFIFSLQMLEGL